MKLKTEFIKLNPEKRLYQLPVPVVGLTGGIATGKTTVSQALEKKGLSVINADLLVKDIYRMQETKDFIANLLPAVMVQNEISFQGLREKVFTDGQVKAQVEAFIYQRLPMAFLSTYQKLGKVDFLIYDVPLLFEKKMNPLFDLTVLVYASRKVQHARLMNRDGHLAEMADTIIQHQMDIEEKKLKADFIIDNTKTETELAEEINQFLRQVVI
jgi:dephospho-CoA kinase